MARRLFELVPVLPRIYRRSVLGVAAHAAIAWILATPAALAQDSYYVHQGRRVPLERSPSELLVGAVERGRTAGATPR